MELFLNVLWLLLAVPAVWIWRRDGMSRRGSERLEFLRCPLILACTLMLLFPVVSATDDLHAMRPEVEESTPSKRAVRPASGGKLPLRLSGPIPAQMATSAALGSDEQVCEGVIPQPVLAPDWVQRGAATGRAPPALCHA
jgi:hypothetical protein